MQCVKLVAFDFSKRRKVASNDFDEVLERLFLSNRGPFTVDDGLMCLQEHSDEMKAKSVDSTKITKQAVQNYFSSHTQNSNYGSGNKFLYRLEPGQYCHVYVIGHNHTRKRL